MTELEFLKRKKMSPKGAFEMWEQNHCIKNHSINNLNLCNCASKVQTSDQ